MQIDTKVILGLIVSGSFIISLWSKPKMPLRALFISILVFFLSFFLQQSTQTEKRFLPVDDSFVLLEEKVDEDIHSWQFIYGTNKNIDEVRTYYRLLAGKKNLLEKFASFIPGGQFYNNKSIHEFGDTKKGGLLLDFHYGIDNSALIDITSPPAFKRANGYKTAIYISYRLARSASIKIYLLLMPLLAIMSILSMWTVTGVIKTLKGSLNK